MSNNIKWIFYDSYSKTQSNPISTEEAQMAIFKMRPKDAERFYLWTQGWQDWHSLTTYLQSGQTFFVSSFTIPKTNDDTLKATIRDVLEAAPSTNKLLHDEFTKSYSAINLNETMSGIDAPDKGVNQFDGEDITWSGVEKPKLDLNKFQKNKNLDNRETRHELKIEVILISPKGRSFRSKSKNISLSGSLLEDNIPFDYFGSVFDLVIVNQQTKDPSYSRVSLKGKTVGDGLTQRLCYVDITDTQRNNLQKLLQDYIHAQRAQKKSA